MVSPSPRTPPCPPPPLPPLPPLPSARPRLPDAAFYLAVKDPDNLLDYDYFHNAQHLAKVGPGGGVCGCGCDSVHYYYYVGLPGGETARCPRAVAPACLASSERPTALVHPSPQLLGAHLIMNSSLAAEKLVNGLTVKSQEGSALRVRPPPPAGGEGASMPPPAALRSAVLQSVPAFAGRPPTPSRPAALSDRPIRPCARPAAPAV